MARGRIFSSRRMFSTRRDAFSEASRNSGPLGVVLGLTAAGIIIFAIGIYVGAKFPTSFGFGASAPLPVAATPPVANAPVVTFAPETPSDLTPGEPADGTTPDAANAPAVNEPAAATAAAPAEMPVTAPAPAAAPTPAPTQNSPAPTNTP
ncbi:MAG: hypothetical protein ACOH12_05655 [Parvibaculaceae bacterium]